MATPRDVFRPPPPSHANVQCPACGRYGALYDTEYVGGRLNRWYGLSGLVGAVGPLVMFIFVGVLSFSILGQSSLLLVCLITVLVSVLVGAAGIWWQDKVRSSSKRIHHFHCDNCRNTWTWKEGTPIPFFRQPQVEDM